MAEKAKTKLKDFLSEVRKTFLPRSDRFEVEITFPAGVSNSTNTVNIATLYCEEASIPGMSVTNLPVKIGPWTTYRAYNVEFITTEIVFTFIADGKWQLREAFEEWMNLCADRVSKEVQYTKYIISESIKVSSLDTNNNIIATWEYKNCMPKMINIVPVSSSNPGVMRHTVTFSAEWWEKTY